MADYKGVLADLRARRAALDKERIDLDTAIAAIGRLASVVNSTGPMTALESPSMSSRTFAGLTMPQAIAKYFGMVNQPQTTRQVMDALRAGGIKSKGALRGHVYNTLHRLSQDDGPFRHEDDSRWSLREWKSPESAKPDAQNALWGDAAR